MPRLPALVEKPEGLLYQPEFVRPEEEAELVNLIEQLEFSEVRMHGQAAKRTVVHFGLRYQYEPWKLVPAEPLPEPLGWLRERAATFAGTDPELFVETLVTRYPPGAGIGWHRDAPMFGPEVVGVSLLSPCEMRFQRRGTDLRSTYRLELSPRSAYALTGAVRSSWQHSIVSTPALRYSVTFRTLRAMSQRGQG
jgi:alkylated DNA repair protein (DNA oxidative demethylase)